MKAGSAAKLIVDALLQRFLPLARRRIETAQVQVRIFVCVCDSFLFTAHFFSLLCETVMFLLDYDGSTI